LSRKQTDDDCAVVSLDNDARNIRGNRIKDHNGPYPSRIPEEEDWAASHHDPVGEFTPSGLGEEAGKVDRIAGLEPLSRKRTAYPSSAIGQHYLPPANMKVPAIKLRFTPCDSIDRTAAHESAWRQARDTPGDTEL